MKIGKSGLALAVAALFSSSTFAHEGNMQGRHMMNHHPVKCFGVNKCRGMSACRTMSNSCRGQNSCKGKGFKMMNNEQMCHRMGGKVMHRGMMRGHEKMKQEKADTEK